MPIFDIYSKRQKRLRGEAPDVFQYQNFPEPFRNQVIQILRDTLGDGLSSDTSSQAYGAIQYVLCREYGRFRLSTSSKSTLLAYEDVFGFIHDCGEYEKLLDVIEISFRYIDTETRESNFQRSVHVRMYPEEAIEELNQRFLEHGLGYQYESGKIVRIDSKLIHAEVVKPALLVLNEKMYGGANDEYLIAHEHYRNGRNKECLIYCCKAFESVMKAICDKHKWVYDKGDTAKRLLDICFEKELIPPYLQSHYSSLRSSLESGVPTLRNQLAGHGQGSTPIDVPPYIAAYLLHLTATSILFLTDAEKELK
jgi:hypothetical protein